MASAESVPFVLDEKSVAEYENYNPFANNVVGYIAFQRSYARSLPNGKKENWYQVCYRVVNACYNVQKDHIERNNLGWDSIKATESAKEMFVRMVTMKFLCAGRGLFAFGSKAITERRLFESLFNCVPKGSLIFTKGGLFRIEDTEIGQEVLTSDGYHKILNKFDQGIRKLVKIKTQDGFFQCTPDHLLAVFNSCESYEWKTAGELKEGDRLITPRVAIEGTRMSLPSWNYERDYSHGNRCKDIVIPDLDGDMAWFIGLFQGDGCTQPHYDKNGKKANISLTFGIDELAMAEKAKQQIERFGDMHVTIFKSKTEECYIENCCCKQLSWYLDKNVKQSHSELKIPEFIIKNTKEIKLAYASGLMDSDGSCKHRTVYVLSTIYPNFAKEVQILLYSCGIESRIKVDDAKSSRLYEGKPKKIYSLALITMHSKREFNSIPELHKNFTFVRPNFSNGFPHSFISNAKIKYKLGLYSNHQIPIDTYCRQYGLTKWCPCEVKSILEDEDYQTYDIEIEGIHEYYVNGYLSHNCAFVTTENIDKEYSTPFTWIMNSSMLGVGVATDVRGRGKMMIHEPDEKKELFIVPDSREGWVTSLEKLLNSYFYNDHRPTVIFDYSQIRPEGTPLKAFGGLASGAEPLMKMHEGIREVLEKNKNSPITTITIADIANLIAVCVISGNIRRCISGNSYVFTRIGLVRMKDLKVGQEVMTGDGSYHRITNKFDQGIQRLIKIKTQNGELRCTSNHKMAVISSCETYEWKMAGDLKEGDRLATPRIAIEGSKTELPEWNYVRPSHSTTCVDITIPELDENMSWFLGLMCADGYVCRGTGKNGNGAHITVALGINELDMAEKAKQQIERFGDIHVSVKKERNKNMYCVRCKCKQLAWYLYENLKQPKTEIQIPEYILKANTEIKLAFVAGVMDGDGTVINGRTMRVLQSIYERFAKGIQILLFSCGIESKLACYDNPPSVKKLYCLTLVTNHSKQRFCEILVLHKKGRICASSKHANGFPSSFIKDKKVKRKYGLYTSPQINIDSYCREFGTIKWCPSECKSVTEDEEEQTYDIEVENKHEFYADGYLMHNSAQLILGDSDDREFLDLKNAIKYPYRRSHSWASNNSVISKIGMDYSQIAEKISHNGEPGLFWIENARNYSRMCDPPDYKDKKVLGTNPCGEIS